MRKSDDGMDDFRRELWQQSSDEVRRLRTDSYMKGQSDGRGLPWRVKVMIRAGRLFGIMVGLGLLAVVGYLAVKAGGLLAQLLTGQIG